jgi:PadR family transcriptional regulator, regulatory protein PadR
MRSASASGQFEALVLAALADGPLHGYGVIESIRARSGGHFDLLEGTVYPLLHGLEAGRLLSSKWDDASGRRRRVYALTSAGRKALDEHRSGWADHVRAVNAVLGRPAQGFA